MVTILPALKIVPMSMIMITFMSRFVRACISRVTDTT
jgi:hypothetical protein